MIHLRRYFLITLIATASLTITPVSTGECVSPVLEVIRQGVIRAIRALDLKIQRLQNKTIALQNAQKAIENALSKLKLEEIAEWAKRQRDLYKKFYDELWKVRNALSTYKRVSLIIKRQQQIIEQYRFTWSMINQDKHFTREEIAYMQRVYTGILNESAHNLDQIITVINSFKMQMSDAKRLEIIANAGDRIEENYNDLRQFNEHNVRLSLNRAKDQQEINTVRKLYGIEQ
jgi:hypothetical protein